MLGLGQTAKLIEGKATADFDPPVILLDGLGKRVRSALRARIASAIVACVPMASIVTMQPSSASVLSNSGVAVFSFDFLAVARCSSTSPAPAAKPLTSS